MKTPNRRKRTTKRCYVVISEQTNYRHGAFPLTKEGHRLALDYIEILEKESQDTFAIKKQ